MHCNRYLPRPLNRRQLLRQTGNGFGAAALSALLADGSLSMGHARALLSITQPRVQAEIAALIARKGLSVRATEMLVKKTLAGGGRKAGESASATDPNIRRLQEELSGRLGARVSIQHRAKGDGKLVVSYNSLDELDGILEHIK